MAPAIATALSKEAHMADVIPLALRRRWQPRFCAYPQQTAAILFFTGVRYERPTEPAAKRTSAQRDGRAAPAKPVGRRKARRPA
ncbi:MAG: hypothetical protein BGO20_22660 [Bosea sp. 67-29]|nr:MAG: hypothetical protein BGO20_22660 [Bosea sp. 67-29]